MGRPIGWTTVPNGSDEKMASRNLAVAARDSAPGCSRDQREGLWFGECGCSVRSSLKLEVPTASLSRRPFAVRSQPSVASRPEMSMWGCRTGYGYNAERVTFLREMYKSERRQYTLSLSPREDPAVAALNSSLRLPATASTASAR